MEAANACADACDAQDNERRDKDLALQGEKDKVRRRLEHWDALQVRAAALHASSALVSSHQSDRPRASSKRSPSARDGAWARTRINARCTGKTREPGSTSSTDSLR